MIIAKIRSSDRRVWEYYLQKRFKSKRKLEFLIDYLIKVTVADEAKKDLEDNKELMPPFH